MRVATLGSGSRGNSVYIESSGTRLLIDAGFSGATLAARLEGLGVEPESIDAVIVTHEHRDHSRGIGIGARRWGWTLVMTRATAEACETLLKGTEEIVFCQPEILFEIGELSVRPFATCHDAADPVAVTVTDRNGLTAGIATDLGRATGPVRAALRSVHFLVLESNHDEVMLRESPYPWSIKQRIGGSRGHLSNRLAAELAANVAHADLGGILLAHLSDECNEPARARMEIQRGLAKSRFRGALDVAGQDAPSARFEVGRLVDGARGAGPQLNLFVGR